MTISILIAEDHALVRDGIRAILQSESDITVVGEARDGAEAVLLAATLNPDVVLMDIAMPTMNGVEATRAIKAANPRATVLVLTAYDDDAYVFALLESGAAGYLMKSAPGDQLLAGIRAAYNGESVLSLSVARKVMPRFAGATNRNGNPQSTLTTREVEVLRLAAQGMGNVAIAQELAVGARTVQFHLAQIFEKLRVGSRTEAVVVALKQGWLRLDQIQ